MSDIFGGSVASRRTRSSIVSRSNTTASTATTRDGSIAKFSHRSRSTAATSVYDDDASVGSKPRSVSRSRKLFKRGKSPALGTESDYDPSPSHLSRSVGGYPRASSEEPDLGSSDGEEEAALSRSGPNVSSEWDLKMRLDLARQNSEAQTQFLHTRSVSEPVDAPVYEGGYGFSQCVGLH
jgi:protein ECT2